ncbi:unnamed protein product, partial [Prorocentrum cordatum]
DASPAERRKAASFEMRARPGEGEGGSGEAPGGDDTAAHARTGGASETSRALTPGVTPTPSPESERARAASADADERAAQGPAQAPPAGRRRGPGGVGAGAVSLRLPRKSRSRSMRGSGSADDRDIPVSQTWSWARLSALTAVSWSKTDGPLDSARSGSAGRPSAAARANARSSTARRSRFASVRQSVISHLPFWRKYASDETTESHVSGVSTSIRGPRRRRRGGNSSPAP